VTIQKSRFFSIFYYNLSYHAKYLFDLQRFAASKKNKKKFEIVISMQLLSVETEHPLSLPITTRPRLYQPTTHKSKSIKNAKSGSPKDSVTT